MSHSQFRRIKAYTETCMAKRAPTCFMVGALLDRCCNMSGTRRYMYITCKNALPDVWNTLLDIMLGSCWEPSAYCSLVPGDLSSVVPFFVRCTLRQIRGYPVVPVAHSELGSCIIRKLLINTL